MLSHLARFLFPQRDARAHEVYISLIAQSRNPFFYQEAGVPDTIDGRHELIVLHLFLLLDRLKMEVSEACSAFGRDLIEVHFSHMDQSLREMGVGDMGVGRRVKAMATALYGHLNAYDAAKGSEEKLAETLRRNVYGTADAPEPNGIATLARYVLSAQSALAEQQAASLMANEIYFGPR